MAACVLMCVAMDHAEEDEEPRKWEILPWAMGVNWQQHLKSWAAEKEALWRRINFRVFVTKHQCDQVMVLAPDHQAWSRRRAVDHGGAKRMRKEENFVPTGPEQATPQCSSCAAAEKRKDRNKRWMVITCYYFHKHVSS